MSDIQAQARRDAEFDRLLANSNDGMYTEGEMRAAFEMGKRHGRGIALLSSIAPFSPVLTVVEKVEKFGLPEAP